MNQVVLGTQEVVREYLRNQIYSNKGRFITVDFFKKDGSLRKMNGRTGVKKNLRGGENLAVASGNYPNLITFYDVKVQDYRMINLDTVQEIRMMKGKIRVE